MTRGRFWLLQLGVALCWLAIFQLSAILEYAPHASLWYPPAALTYAAFRIYRWRALPAIGVAVMIATAMTNHNYQYGLSSGQLLAAGALSFLAHAGPYFLAAALMGRVAPDGASRGLPQSVLGFMLIATVCSLLAAIAGSLAVAASGMAEWHELEVGILPWWIGDFAGLLALGPPFVALLGLVNLWAGLGRHHLTPPASQLRAQSHRSGLAIKLATSLAIVVLTIGLASAFPANEPLGFLLFFVIIPQMWIVHSESARRSLLSIAAMSTAIALSTRLFGATDLALLNQFAMIIIACSSYFGMSVPMLYADNAELRDMLTRDTLTGAASRHFFVDQARKEIDRASRYDEPLALIALDIDRFKTINDRFGHPAGDRVLVRLAQQCLAQLRGSDLLGRMGGDEFMVMLPMTTIETAQDAAERLRAAIDNAQDEDEPRPTISVGVVQVSTALETQEQAFERVDQALYAAKRAGRNCVRSG